MTSTRPVLLTIREGATRGEVLNHLDEIRDFLVENFENAVGNPDDDGDFTNDPTWNRREKKQPA